MAESAEPLTDSTALALTADPAKMLTELTTAANLQYSLKNYTAAADLYSEATELQATLNGELAPENAELLYLYGRCLYHVAVANSDVLGGKVAGEKKEKSDTKTNGEGRSNSALPDADQKLAEVVEAAVESKEGMKQSAAEQLSVEDKPYFQFTGDENWDTESDDADDEEGAEDADNDDFANAYEVLELARVLNTRRLDALEHEDQANESTARTGPILRSVRIAQLLASHKGAAVRALMERLADIHDLQGEINLENEKFSDAIPDFREALDMKMAIHRPESALIAEAHFKLSLALEFASMMAVREAQNADSDDTAAADPPEVDKHMREEAAEHMDSAIASCRARVAKEEAELQNLDGVLAAEKTKSINDVKEMIQDMLTRLTDLRSSPADTGIDSLTGPAGAPDGSDPLLGLLGSILGESPAQQKARIEEATSKANDLSGLVRHRKKPKVDPSVVSVSKDKGKRKADDGDAAEANGGDHGRKRSRVDEMHAG